MSQSNEREAVFSELMISARQYVGDSTTGYLSFFNCPYSGNVEVQLFDNDNEEVMLDDAQLKEIASLAQDRIDLTDKQSMSVSRDSVILSGLTELGGGHDAFAFFDYTDVDSVVLSGEVPSSITQDLLSCLSDDADIREALAWAEDLKLQVKILEDVHEMRCLGSIDLRNIENLPSELGSFVDDLDEICTAVLDIHESIASDLRTATLSVFEPCEETGKMMRAIKSSYRIPSASGAMRLN